MHEMSIAAQLVEISISSIPPDMMGMPVEKVNLKIGRLTALVPESLEFCFSALSENTPLAGAQLIVEEVPVTAGCEECGEIWTVDQAVFRCRKCQSGDIKIISGEELEISSIEIADD
ncbi:MAG: hydrogenase maturation nickel metallochaperone HypA [Desulfobacterales bacterium]|nr:MAG: hydrogenase maturation nickel metallochaperone HypA [Desulfobacterales bacterium]